MSIELETARQQLAAGDLKKALRTLWLVEAKARADFDEARGLVEVAKKLSESSDGKVRKDAELLKEWRLQASSTRCQRARTSTRSSGSRHELASFSFTQALSRRRHSLSPVFTRLRGKDRAPGVANGDKIDRLTRLADLLDRGAISAEEFAKLKADLLS